MSEWITMRCTVKNCNDKAGVRTDLGNDAEGFSDGIDDDPVSYARKHFGATGHNSWEITR